MFIKLTLKSSWFNGGNMHNWLKKDLDYLIASYQKDIELISKKKKDEEWKRDHYRYISAVHFQRILNNLNTNN
jgi:hypothetical protein